MNITMRLSNFYVPHWNPHAGYIRFFLTPQTQKMDESLLQTAYPRKWRDITNLTERALPKLSFILKHLF